MLDGIVLRDACFDHPYRNEGTEYWKTEEADELCMCRKKVLSVVRGHRGHAMLRYGIFVQQAKKVKTKEKVTDCLSVYYWQ